MEIKVAVSVLGTLAQQTRLSIYRVWWRRDVTEIGRTNWRKVENSRASSSFHLKELVRAGLVTARQDRQFIYYAADFEQMAELMTFLTQNCCQGMPQNA